MKEQAMDPSTFRVIQMDPVPMKHINHGPPHPSVPVEQVTLTTKAVVQHQAPLFEADAVHDGQFKRVRLQDYRGKYVVLIFYPLDFTFVCPTELIAFSDRIDEFRHINAEVLALSVDSKYTHLAWANTPRNSGGLGGIKIPLIADLTKQISTDYGVLLRSGDDAGASLRGLFIIDEKGILRQITVNDLPVGRSVDETLRLVRAFQFADSNDVVCPANWRPGDLTIKANPTESLDYFKKVNA